MSLVSAVEPVRAVLERPHGLLEGPRIAASGELIYSDVLAGGVYAVDADDQVRELLPKRRGVGGIVPHADGGWVISGRTLVHLAPDGTQRELRGEQDACGYNDLGSTPAGELVAGVLRFRPFAGEEPVPGRLLLLGGEGSERVLSEDVLWPNGIGVTGEGEVFVSDYARGLVLALDLDGAPARELAKVPLGSADGLALDSQGGIWVALGEAGGIARLRSDGTVDEVVDLPTSFVSSVSFGGPDMREMLITTADNEVAPQLGGTLLRARCEIPGLPVYPLRV